MASFLFFGLLLATTQVFARPIALLQTRASTSGPVVYLPTPTISTNYSPGPTITASPTLPTFTVFRRTVQTTTFTTTAVTTIFKENPLQRRYCDCPDGMNRNYLCTTTGFPQYSTDYYNAGGYPSPTPTASYNYVEHSTAQADSYGYHATSATGIYDPNQRSPTSATGTVSGNFCGFHSEDQVSNAKCNFQPLAQRPNANRLHACLATEFRNANLEGSCKKVEITVNECMSFSAELHDRMSSVEAPAGYTCTLFADKECTGKTGSVFYSGVPDLSKAFNGELNNAATSFKCAIGDCDNENAPGCVRR